MEKLGLLNFIGTQTANLIAGVEGDNRRLLVAIVLILWVSAIASSFIDNIPFTTAMVSEYSFVTVLSIPTKINLAVHPFTLHVAHPHFVICRNPSVILKQLANTYLVFLL